MAPLVLLALLAGGVLYLAGAIYFLYRYLNLKSVYPMMPRVWHDLRRRFIWLGILAVGCLVGFGFTAYWTMPGHQAPWLLPFFDDGQTVQQVRQMEAKARQTPVNNRLVRQRVEVPDTTMATTTWATTTETTTTESTTSTTITMPPVARPPQAAKPAPAKKTARPGGWTVCAASFKEEAPARRYADKLRAQGLEVSVNKARLGSRGTWYRVCVGSFASLNQAKASSREWEKKGLISDPFLLPRR